MTYDEFKTLSDEEQAALFASMDDTKVLYDDMEAERDSFKSENDSIKKELKDLKAELKKTKELNFTLARNSSGSKPQKDAEEFIHEMFSNRRN